MRDVRLVSGLILGAALAASPVYAQLEPETQLGSRIPVKPRSVEPDQAGRIKQAFARCLFLKQPIKIAALLYHSDPLSIDGEAAGFKGENLSKDLGMDGCLGDQVGFDQLALSMKTSSAVIRAMLQEAAYLALFQRAAQLAPDAAEDVGRLFISTGEQLPSARAMGFFADCVVFRDASGADNVLRTLPDSAEERAAAKALAPALGACLVEGQTLSLKPANIRIFAADGLWTRFVRQSKPAMGKAN